MDDPAAHYDHNPHKEAEPLIAAETPPLALPSDTLLEGLENALLNPLAYIMTNLVCHGNLQSLNPK